MKAEYDTSNETEIKKRIKVFLDALKENYKGMRTRLKDYLLLLKQLVSEISENSCTFSL